MEKFTWRRKFDPIVEAPIRSLLFLDGAYTFLQQAERSGSSSVTPPLTYLSCRYIHSLKRKAFYCRYYGNLKKNLANLNVIFFFEIFTKSWNFIGWIYVWTSKTASDNRFLIYKSWIDSTWRTRHGRSRSLSPFRGVGSAWEGPWLPTNIIYQI